MKTTVFFSLMFLCVNVICAQIDYGYYVKHQQLGSEDAAYQFFYNDGYFTYCTDNYNQLTGYICISGHFVIEKDTILFFDLSIELPVYSELSRLSDDDLGQEIIIQDSIEIVRQIPSNSGFWSLNNTVKRTSIKVNPEKQFSASFKRDNNHGYIEIDGEKYYEHPGPKD